MWKLKLKHLGLVLVIIILGLNLFTCDDDLDIDLEGICFINKMTLIIHQKNIANPPYIQQKMKNSIIRIYYKKT